MSRREGLLVAHLICRHNWDAEKVNRAIMEGLLRVFPDDANWTDTEPCGKCSWVRCHPHTRADLVLADDEIVRRHQICIDRLVAEAWRQDWDPKKVQRAIMEGQLRLTPAAVNWEDDEPRGLMQFVNCDESILKVGH